MSSLVYADDKRAAGLGRQVAIALRHAIVDGEFGPGDKLPTEKELSTRHGVSRATIRDALRILQEESLIDRRQGSGSYVRPRPKSYIPLLRGSYSRSIEPFEREMSREVKAWRWIEADARVADAMSLHAGESLLWAERCDTLNGKPVATDELWIAGQAAAGMTRSDLQQLRFIEAWQAKRLVKVSHVRQRIEAAAASSHIARLLDVRRGSPLLREEDLAFVVGRDAPAARFVTHYRNDVYLMESTVVYR